MVWDQCAVKENLSAVKTYMVKDLTWTGGWGGPPLRSGLKAEI